MLRNIQLATPDNPVFFDPLGRTPWDPREEGVVAGKLIAQTIMASTASLGASGKKGISVVIEKSQRDAVTAAVAAVNPAEDTPELREQILLELVRQARESHDDDTIQLTWVPLTDEMKRLIDKFFWDNASKPRPLKPPMQADIIDMYRSEIHDQYPHSSMFFRCALQKN
jgi:hypothetical protein